MIKTTFNKVLVCVFAWGMAAWAFAATPVAMFEGGTLVDGATYTATNGIVYTLAANGNTAIAGGGIQISGTKGVSVTPSSGNIGNQASTVIIRYTGYDTSSLTETDAQALIINHTANTTYKDFLGMAATAGGNLWGVWQNTTWGANKTSNGKYGSTASETKKFALAWDQFSTVQIGTWFWMDGGDKQGWSTLHGNLQIDSIWVGGPNESTTVKPATGMKILSIAVFDRRLTDDEITGFKFPSEGGTAVYGAIWGNIGTSASDPGVATASSYETLNATESLTLNFGATNNISQRQIVGTGRVRVTEVRILQRSGQTANPPDTLTLSQADGTEVVSSSATRIGGVIWWANGTSKKNGTWVYTFADDTTLDASADITLKFSAKAVLYALQPANSVCQFSGGTHSPAIQVTGDWTPPRVLSVNIAQYWNGTNGSTTDNPTVAGQVTTDQTTLLGTIPAAAWAQSAADNIPTIENQGRGSTFAAPKISVGSAVVDNPSTTRVRAYFAAGTNLNGYDTFVNTFRQTMLTAKNTNAGSGNITVTDIPFELYDAIIYMSSTSASAMNPVSVNGTYLVPTDVEGVNTVAASATSPTWGNGQTATLTYGANAMRVNALSGDLTILHTAASWGIAAVQLVERGSTTYTATVNADTAFEDIAWSPETPATGFAAGDKLVITVEGTPTISFSDAYSTEAALTINGAAKIAASDSFYEDGCFIKTFASFAQLTAESVTYADIKSGFTGAYGKTATGFTLRAQNKEVVSVNFKGSKSEEVSGEGFTGLAPTAGATWNNLSGASGTAKELKVTADGSAATTAKTLTVSYSASTAYAMTTAYSDVFLYGYLDDSTAEASRATVTVEGIPYSAYDVIVYASTDTASRKFRPVAVNGISYTADDANPETAAEGTAEWGASCSPTAVYNTNALRIRNLSGTTLTVRGGIKSDTARGGIAAIQIVCTGENIAKDYTLEMDGDVSASSAAWKPAKTGAFTAADTITITNTATKATFTADEDITVRKLKIVSESGKLWVFKKNDGITTDFGSLDFSEAVEGVGYDCTAGFTACDLLLDYARTHDEKFTFFGTGENGALVDYGTENKNYTFAGHYVFEGGTHTFQNACETGAAFNFGANATAENPTLWAKAGTTLRLKSRNPCGYNNTTANTDGIVRIGEGAKVVAMQTDSNVGTWYWGQQFYFESGAELKLETTGDNFRVVGGDTAGAPQFYMPNAGTATITGLDGSFFCLPNNTGSGAAAEVGAGATLTISADMKTLADGKPLVKHGDGTLALTGDLSAFGAAVTAAEGTLEVAPEAWFKDTATLSVSAGATLRIDAGAGVITNKCVLTNNGTVEVAGGTVVFMPGTFNGTITTSGSGKVIYGYTVNINMLGRFPLPDGRTKDDVLLFDLAGNEVKFDEKDGVLIFDWGITDGNCWWDYEFNGNLKSTGTDTTTMTAEGTEPYYNTESNRLWVGHATPYRGATYSAEFTAVMRGRIVGVSKQVEIGFGSTTKGSTYSVALACGDPANEEVLLLISQGYTVLKTISMTVPNAYDGDHLYAFSCQTVNDGGIDKTQLTVYLDGNRLQVYAFDGEVLLGSGFQVGSVHGWPPTGYAKADTSAANDNAMLDFLRVYPLAVTDEAMAEYAKKYPYVSPNGVAGRTFSGDANWTTTDAWQITPYEDGPYVTNKPPAKANVVISATSASTVTFDLAEAANYETFTATNGAAITLRKGGTVKPSVKGFMTVGIALTADYDAMSLADTPIVVQDGKTLAFDFSSLDVSGVWANTTNVLTGIVTLKGGAHVTGVNLPEAAGRTVTFAVNEETHRGELRITVADDPFICTVDADGTTTWTWAGEQTTEAVADAHTAFAIWKEGEGTLTKAINRTFAVKEGTLKAKSASTATVTVETNAVFDVNGVNNATLMYTVILAGGRLENKGTSLSVGKTQYKSISLTDDSFLGGSGNFAFVSYGYADNILELGGHTLYKDGANTFTLANTTVTNGSLVVSNGTLEVSSNKGGSKRVSFVDADLALCDGSTLYVVSEQTLNVGRITAEGGSRIVNSGTISAFALAGEAVLQTNSLSAKWGEITLDGTLDIGTLRGLTIGGTGTVNVELSATEVDAGNAIALFTPGEGANVKVGIVMYEGQDITDRCQIEGAVITSIDCEAMIGTKKYVTLADAIKAVSSGGTIVLLRDGVTMPEKVESDRTFTLDADGHELAIADCRIHGDVTFANGKTAGGVMLSGDLRTMEGDARLALSLANASGSGRILVDRGTLATAGTTMLGNDIVVEIAEDGTLDLSAGTSLACDRFASSGGGCVGTAATLIVTGTLDARYATTLTCLELADGARLQAGKLAVTDRLVVSNRFLYVETGNDDLKIATVPAGTRTDNTRITYNGIRGCQLVCEGTELKAAWYSNRWTDYADESGIRKEGDVYSVSSGAGLAWLAAQSTNGWISGTVKLGQDIDLSGWNWVPVAQFTGTFDGGGHTVRGLNNTNFVERFGDVTRCAHGVTNDWSYSAYGLFASATNAVFRNVKLEDAAISVTADSAAALLGVHAGGDLEIAGVTVGGRVEGEGRAVAGITTVGGRGEAVGDVVVTGNVSRATVVGGIADNADGGNVAQVLAGTTWDTVFAGTVVATNNTGAGAFEVTVNGTPWGTSDYVWLDLPVCNLAAAVLHTDDEGVFRSCLEANAVGAVPVDPVHGTARMLAGQGSNGTVDILGGWTDQISALPDGATLVITNDGTAVELDGWSTVLVDRNVTIDLKGNGIYQVYDCDVFDIAAGATLTVRNGKISVGPGCEAFAGAGKGVCGEGCEIVRLSESFEGRTFEKVKSASMAAGKMSLVVPQTSAYCQYGIETKQSLSDGWQVVPGSVTRGNGGDLELEAPAEAASGFYRVNTILNLNE